MDYKEEYQEALERAKKGLPIDEVFPELKESEDERIRKEIVDFIYWAIDRGSITKEQRERSGSWLAYLEKQKDILEERVKNITANMLEDRIEGVQRDLIEFLSNNVNASWVDIIQSADAYAERIRNIIEKQKEQKPSWAKIDNSKENVVFPFNARVKDSGKIVTIIDGQLNFDGKQWIKFASNRDDGFKVYYPEDLLVEQKPVEWSEEDEKQLNWFYRLLDFIDKEFPLTWGQNHKGGKEWLKSLPERFKPQPHWKPSEEQMEALKLAIEGKWDAILPTGYMSRRLEDLYEGLANTFGVECNFKKWL